MSLPLHGRAQSGRSAHRGTCAATLRHAASSHAAARARPSRGGRSSSPTLLHAPRGFTKDATRRIAPLTDHPLRHATRARRTRHSAPPRYAFATPCRRAAVRLDGGRVPGAARRGAGARPLVRHVRKLLWSSYEELCAPHNAEPEPGSNPPNRQHPHP
eukprot:4965372-Prymnesium_polylepis.2